MGCVCNSVRRRTRPTQVGAPPAVCAGARDRDSAVCLSELGPETIRRARAVHAITDRQIEYSVISRRPEEKLFPAPQDLGIGVTA